MCPHVKASRLDQWFAVKLGKFKDQLSRYIESPDVNAIHDARTAFRRLQACYGIYPKSARSGAAESFMGLASEFFSLNSTIRDSDIILQKLENLERVNIALQSDVDALRENLQPLRHKRTQEALKLAKRLDHMPAPALRATPATLKKRLKSKVAQRTGTILGHIPLIGQNEGDSEEIHAMRKQAKKLYYLLELVAGPGHHPELDHLKDIHGQAGDIHDCDVAIDYLKENSELLENSAGLIRVEEACRHDHYEILIGLLERINWSALTGYARPGNVQFDT